MKKIGNIAAPTIVTTRKDPFNVSLSILQVGGQPLTQSQDTSQNLWIPDRELDSPLLLEPVLEVTDHQTGVSVTTNVTYSWYLDKVSLWDSSSKKGLVSAYSKDRTIGDRGTNDGFFLETTGSADSGNLEVTGRLLVARNVNYVATVSDRGPITVICVAQYTDSTRTQTYEISQSVVLTSGNIPDDQYSLNILQPSSVAYHPLTDTTPIREFDVEVMMGKRVLKDGELEDIRYFWYLDGVLIPTDGSLAAYKEGQHTSSLKLDLDYIDSGDVSVRIAVGKNATVPNVNAVDSRSIEWKVPKLTATPYSKSGSAVRNTGEVKEFEAIVQARGGDVDENHLKEFIRLNWQTKSTASETRTNRGWGKHLTLTSGQLIQGGRANTEVGIDVYMLGIKEGITAGGEAVTCNNEMVYART